MKLSFKRAAVVCAILTASLGVLWHGELTAGRTWEPSGLQRMPVQHSSAVYGSRLHTAEVAGMEGTVQTARRPAPIEPPVDGRPDASPDADSVGQSVDAGSPNSEDALTPAAPADSSVKGSNAALSNQQQTTADEATALAGSASVTPIEMLMLQSINTRRSQAGLAQFELDDRLVQLSRIRSEDMAANNYFSHTAPDGSSARDLMIASKIGPGLMGEILGRNNSADSSQSVASVVDAFMNSPSHKDAMMNPRFSLAGVGTAYGADNLKYYTVLFFGP